MADTYSKKIYSLACDVIPGGVSRNMVFRKPYPDYVEKASGCRITDVDGITRVDFSNNMAALIHGHSHPVVIEAVMKQLQKGTAYTMASEIEVTYARYFCDRVPGIEKIRFVNSGTEAVMAMIKTARAFTGRSKIAKAEGVYHGTYDFAEVSQNANPSNWGNVNHPNSVPVAFGTPSSVLDDVVVFPFNDIERTLAILDNHADQIACVMLDPVPLRIGLLAASKEYVEALHHWTRRNNALLVFDEVVTFRINYSGAQEIYSIRPDLTAFGKIIGGGFSVGAFGGRSEIMQVLDPRQEPLLFPYSGTFSANPVTMTAGYTAMNLFNKEAVMKLNAMTRKAIDQIEEAIRIANVPVSVTGAGSMFRLHLQPIPPATYREAYQAKETVQVINELLDHLYHKENILVVNTFACVLSTVITQTEVDHLSEAILRTFKLYKPRIEHTQNR